MLSNYRNNQEVLTFIIANCVKRSRNLSQSCHFECHRSCRICGIESESILKLLKIEEMSGVPFRVQNIRDQVREHCGITFVQPGVAPPLASDSVAEELMSKFMADNIDSTAFQSMGDVFVVFLVDQSSFPGSFNMNCSRRLLNLNLPVCHHPPVLHSASLIRNCC
jgi:hypothetical protein